MASSVARKEGAPSHAAQDIEILNQEIDDEDANYRIRVKHKVCYLTMAATVFDEDTMCRPYLLIPKLEKLFPPEDWTQMRISRKPQGDDALQVSTNNDPLPSVKNAWHQQHIDILSLPQTQTLRSNVQKVVYQFKPAIAKFARFDWNIPSMENETWAYAKLDQYQRSHPHEQPTVTPPVLGHLTENGGRVMGLLLEKVEGRCAGPEDLELCRDALRRVHRAGLVHGDVNRYNFIVDDRGVAPQARLVDLEHAEEFDEEKARMELESLVSELNEQTGRGGSVVYG